MCVVLLAFTSFSPFGYVQLLPADDIIGREGSGSKEKSPVPLPLSFGLFRTQQTLT